MQECTSLCRGFGRLFRAGGSPPPYSPIGGGLTYAQGPHATFEKNCIPKGENKSKNRGTSLAKMDKFITFR